MSRSDIADRLQGHRKEDQERAESAKQARQSWRLGEEDIHSCRSELTACKQFLSFSAERSVNSWLTCIHSQ